MLTPRGTRANRNDGRLVFVEFVLEMGVFVSAVAVLPEVVGVEARHGDRSIRGGGSFVALGLGNSVADSLLIVLAGMS